MIAWRIKKSYLNRFMILNIGISVSAQIFCHFTEFIIFRLKSSLQIFRLAKSSLNFAQGTFMIFRQICHVLLILTSCLPQKLIFHCQLLYIILSKFTHLQWLNPEAPDPRLKNLDYRSFEKLKLQSYRAPYGYSKPYIII